MYANVCTSLVCLFHAILVVFHRIISVAKLGYQRILNLAVMALRSHRTSLLTIQIRHLSYKKLFPVKYYQLLLQSLEFLYERLRQNCMHRRCHFRDFAGNVAKAFKIIFLLKC